MSAAELVGKDVELLYASGEVRARARVIAYTDQPTYVVEYPNGLRESWRVDLTRYPAVVEVPADALEKLRAAALDWQKNAEHGDMASDVAAFRARVDVIALIDKCRKLERALAEVGERSRRRGGW